MTLDVHSSRSIPLLRHAIDPQDIIWLWCSWGEKIGEASIIYSEWTLPDGWTAVAYAQAATLAVDGKNYTQTNGVFVNPNGASKGKYQITNQIDLGDGGRLNRSFYVWVRDL